ncbi:MAG: TonB-dependent receptor [Fermentimonas sp.]|nr:TonB-dependent receptor [Fermentimonas sp.]
MKVHLIKRLSVFCLFLLLFSTRLSLAQLSISASNTELKSVLQQIENKSEYTFFYSNNFLDLSRKVSINAENETIEQILNRLFTGTSITYSINNSQIALVDKSKQSANASQSDQQPVRRTVQGTIKDQDGETIIGATIVDKGNPTHGTVTDVDGKFTLLNIPENAVLHVSFVGMKSLDVPVNGREIIDIIMEQDLEILEEIVVVGYSTRSREKLISSVSTISNEELTKSTTPNLENALVGRATGVFSRQSSGEPGSDAANLQIRGFGPALVVVDGIPGRNYSQIDPSEIESISILKDASAAAVYGMQGANGVILVTTKRGLKSKASDINISTRYGQQIPHNYPEVADVNLWQTLVNEYNANMRLINNPNAVITENDMMIREFANETNWYREMIRNAPISQSNINLSGGTDNVAYFVSGGFLHQQGIWSTNSTAKNRVNLRSNLDLDISDNLNLSLGIGAFLDNLNYPGRGATEIARSLKNTAPNIPVRWKDYSDFYAFGGEGTDNPMALADKDVSGYNNSRTKNMNVDLSLKYNVPFIEGLSLKANAGYTTNDIWNKTWYKNIVYAGYRADADEYYQSASASNTNKANLTLYDGTNWSFTGQGFINYLNSFENHNINSGLIFELTQSQIRSTITSRSEFPSTVLDMLTGGLTNKQVSNGESLRNYRAASIIGRFSYDYSSKYFLDFNFRYDGAQYFADKWGFFPSASVGWMVTKENFMSQLQPFVSELKLRASWGKLGDLSAAKGYYDSLEQYYFQSGYRYPGETIEFGDRTIYGLTPTINANPDFTWSSSTMYNLGVDFKLWEGLLNGSAEYFMRSREGLPAQKANDNAGVLATWYNLNNDNTRGFEISLDHKNSISDFKYSIGGNISWARTKNGALEHGRFTSGYDQWKWYNGNRWNNIRWGLNQIGHYLSYEEIKNAPMHQNSNNNSVILPGDLKYEDWNNDGYIDENDMKPIGRTAYPELIYGINLGAEWKNFDLSMFWQGGGLSDFVVGAFDMDAFEEGRTYRNAWGYFNDRWHKADYTNPESEWIPGYFPAVRDMFAITINRLESNYWMWSGSYIRLKNIEIGYTFPGSILGNNSNKIRIYANLYNFLTFSSQNIFDPEQAEYAFSFASYPQIKSFNIGVNLNF